MSDLYEAVRAAVNKQWDPIGVSEFVDDEYDSYIPGLCALLSQNASEAQVFAYLWTIERESMELNGNRDATLRFAKQLVELGHIRR